MFGLLVGAFGLLPPVAAVTTVATEPREANTSRYVAVTAIWGGEEHKLSRPVIDGFSQLYPNVTGKNTSGGDNLAPLLSTAVEVGNPPDIAAVGQPGLMTGFAEQGA